MVQVQDDETSKLRKFTLGKPSSQHQNKTVLLVGPTGSGKSTLINALVNFVMGVKFEDKVWFEIITDKKNKDSQAQSQTTAVSVYQVFGFEGKTVPYSLTIIDTPGFGDTRGTEYDGIVIELLKDLFCVPDGVDTIDAVGLVLKATENRLDERTAYIFNSLTSLFGKNMEQNIVALMTHSQGRKPKQALQALKESKVKCARKENNEPVYFCFNNCQKEKIEDEEAEIAEMDFKMSNKGMKALTEFLGQCQPLSLEKTVEVIRERNQLMARIQNLEERVKTIEMNQEAIERNKKQVLKCEEEMKKNEFKIQESISDSFRRYRETVVTIYNNTTCKKCKENCHLECCCKSAPSGCKVMKDGKCTSCPKKCPVSDHITKKLQWVD